MAGARPAERTGPRNILSVVAKYLFTRFLFKCGQLGADIRISYVGASIDDVLHYLADYIFDARILQVGDYYLLSVILQLGFGLA